MTAAADELQLRWRFAPIDALVRLLAEQGYRIGPSEAIDAARLLKTLAETEPDRQGLPDLQALATRLGPLLCKSADEQQRFRPLFDEWAALAQTVRIEPRAAGVTREDAEPAPPPPADSALGSWWRRHGTLAAALLIGIAIIGTAWWRQQSAPPPAVDRPVAATPAAPVPGPATPPAAAATGDDAATKGALEGYYPQLRHQRELLPAVGWVFLAATLGVLALWLLPAGVPLLGRTRRSGRAVMLDDSALRHDVERIVPPVAAPTFDRLERHVAGPAIWRDRLQRRPPIDVERTVEATLRKLGILQLRHGTARLRPSYLLLIDVGSEDDPRGRLYYRWAERLQRAGIEVQIRLFELDERGRAVTRRPQAPGWRLAGQHGEPLERLPTPPIGQRLVVVSDGGPLLEEKNGALLRRDWVHRARLERWNQRVLFTPAEPRHWGAREDLLATGRSALTVLPLDEAALNAWSVLIGTGVLPRFFLSRPQRYPQLLRETDDSVLIDDALPPLDVQQLLAQLKLYLGANGYCWLAACAVPPVLRWDLTLLLGEHYLRLAGVADDDLPAFIAESYARLARLPWMRHEHIPNWLRVSLLDSLPLAVQDEVRRVTRALLGKLVPAEDGAAALPLELPPGALADAPARQGPGGGDVLYLGFLAGRTPRQLMLRAPNEWGGRVELQPRAGAWRDRLGAWRDRLLFRNGLALFGSARWLRGAALAGTALLVLAVVIEVRLGGAADAPDWLAALHRERSYPVLALHGAQVRDVAFSPDGRQVLSGAADGSVHLFDTTTGRFVGPVLRHWDVRRVSYSPDGKRILTMGTETTVLWDANGKHLHSTTPMTYWDWDRMTQGRIGHQIWSRDGNYYLAVGIARLTVHDARSGAKRAELLTGEPAPDASFSPDARRIVTASANTFRLWDAATGAEIGPPIPFQTAPGKAARSSSRQLRIARYSPNGRAILTAQGEGTVQLWDTATNRPFAPPRDFGDTIADARYSPDGRRIAVASGLNVLVQPEWSDGEATDPGSCAALSRLRHDDAVVQLIYSADSRQLLTLDERGRTRLWDACSGEEIIGATLDAAAPVQAAAVSRDGRQLMTAGSDGAARLWTVRGALVQPLRLGGEAQNQARGAALSADGRYAVTADGDGRVQRWDARTGAAAGAVIQHAGATQVALSADGGLVVSRAGSRLEVRDAEQGTLIGSYESATSAVQLLRINSERQRLIATDFGGKSRIWDIATGLWDDTEHERPNVYCEFDQTRRLLRDLAPSAEMLQNFGRQLGGDPARVRALLDVLAGLEGACVDPSRRVMLGYAADGRVRLWDLATLKPLGTSQRLPGEPRAVSFSGDGRRLVIAWAARPAADATPPAPADAPTAAGAPAANVDPYAQQEAPRDDYGYDAYEQKSKKAPPAAVQRRIAAAAPATAPVPATRGGGVTVWNLPQLDDPLPAALHRMPLAVPVWVGLGAVTLAWVLLHAGRMAWRRRRYGVAT